MPSDHPPQYNPAFQRPAGVQQQGRPISQAAPDQLGTLTIHRANNKTVQVQGVARSKVPPALNPVTVQTEREIVHVGDAVAVCWKAAPEPAKAEPQKVSWPQQGDAKNWRHVEIRGGSGVWRAPDFPEITPDKAAAVGIVCGTLSAAMASGEAERLKADVARLKASLPAYRSHKTVWAAKIVHQTSSRHLQLWWPMPGGGGAGTMFKPPASWWVRVEGVDPASGYLVVYEDGYMSWSPAKAFLDGYSRLTTAGGQHG